MQRDDSIPCSFSGGRVLLGLIAAACLWSGFCSSLTAQSPTFQISEYKELLGTLPDPVDDVVIGPNGEMIISRTQLQEVGVFAPGTANVWTPLTTQPLVALSMTMGPDGGLYIGDSLTHNVLRYDFATGNLSTVSVGFFIPIDIIFDQAGTMYVVDLTTTDFFMGLNDLWAIDVVNGVETNRTFITGSIVGAADIADGLDGKLYLGSLGSATIYSYEVATQAVGVVATNVFLTSDIVALSPGRLLVSTIFQAEVLEIDTIRGTLDTIVTNLGSGSGAEDLALGSSNGKALVTVNTGEVYEVGLGAKFRQLTPAALGERLEWRFRFPGQANWNYAMALSGSLTQGIAVPGNSPVALDYDSLFSLTSAVPRPPGFGSFLGTLDVDGVAYPHLDIPNIPSLSGASFYAAAVLFQTPAAPSSQWIMTNASYVVID